MSKRLVSNFFLFIFTVFIAAPTVISVVEKSYDISIFFNVNEEENKVNETVKLFEVKLNENDKFHFAFLDIEKEKTYASYLKTYAPSTIEYISPPPEFI
jgi:uncharacterized protein YpmS